MNAKQHEYFAIGVTKPRNVFFLDVDSLDFDVYITEGGFHVVADLRKRKFDYHFKNQILRTSPKFTKNLRVVSRKPILAFCHCPKGKHSDKRIFGNLVLYKTRHGVIREK